MTYLDVTVPLSPTAIREKFINEDTVFVVSYKDSVLKGQRFLTYLTNMELEYRIQIETPEDANELIAAYLNMSTMVDSIELEELTMGMLAAHVGLGHGLSYDPSSFLLEHKEILDRWISLIGSLEVYMLSTVSYLASVNDDVVRVDDTSTVGCNFANLLKCQALPSLIELCPPEAKMYYGHLFDADVYRGASLFQYWAVEENPYYVMTMLMCEKQDNGAVFDNEEYHRMVKLTLESVNDVPSI